MADAIEVAALHPAAAFGMIEVRPFLAVPMAAGSAVKRERDPE
jgi:hypothetical protein